MKGSSVGFEAELAVRLQQVNSTTRLSTQPARPELRFRACQIRVRRKLARGRELLRNARVYVCKPDHLAKQSPSRSYEEYSC